MRYGILVALALSWLLLGATCFPLIDLDQDGGVVSGTTLTVSVITPSVDREVPLGAVVEIEWTAANLTGSEAVATILVRAQEDLSETILAGGLRLPEVGTTRSLEWDTGDFQGGIYGIVARIEAGGEMEEARAPGLITINTPPSLDFTEPVEDTELAEEEDPNDPNDPNAAPGPARVAVRWTAFDPDGDGTAQIGIDPDLDHESGNEIIIAERDIPRSSGFGSLDWDGTDQDGERVEADTYNLYAVIADDVNEEQFVEGLARVIVPEEPEPVELAITQPEEDTEFLTSDDPLTIEFTLDEDSDVLVDLKADTDDNHRNGNETTILAQRLIEEGTTEDSFDWNGNNSAGDAVDDGIYRLFLAVNRGSGTPEIAQAGGLVFRRSEQEQPLIALLAPDTDQTVEPGAFVLIRWRDDDPSESATIRLTLDDDETPNEDVETEDDEIEILADWDADGDGVQDTFQYQVPADLAPDRYFIFAYIDRDAAAPFDNISVAGGHIVIEDPEADSNP